LALEKKAVSEFLWVAAPKVIAGVLQIQMNLWLAHALGPEKTGFLFVALNSLLLADAILGAAFDLCVLRLVTAEPDPARDGVVIERTALWMKATAGAVVTLLVYAFSSPLSNLIYGSRIHGHLLFLAALAFGAMLMLRSVQTYFQVRRRFPLYGAADLAQMILRWGGAGVLLLMGLATPESVLTLFAVGPLVVAGTLMATAASPLLSGKGSPTVAKRLARASGWFLASAAAGSAASRLDILMVSSLAGPREAGIFAAGSNLALPLQMFGQYLGLVFAPRILPLQQQGRLASVYAKSQIALAVAALCLFLAAMAGLAYIAPRFLAGSYTPSVPVATWLLGSAAAGILNFPWTISVLMFLRPRVPAAFDLAALPCLAIAYGWIIPQRGAFGAAMVTAGYAALKLVVFQWAGAGAVRSDKPLASLAK
jgi:O-antigen/teichoic acid export membrane protein